MSYLSSEVDKIVDQLLSPMSISDLKEMIALDKPQLDLKLDELIKDLPLIQKLEKEKELLITKNKSLAEFNLEKQPSYNEAHKRLVKAHEQALELQQQTLDKQKKLSAGDRQTNAPDVLRGLLQVAAQEAEEESEALAKKFTNGECTYEQFLEQFVLIRSLSHARRIKYEKLIEHIQRNPPNRSSAAVSSSANSQDNRTASQPPYPDLFPYPYSTAASNPGHHPVLRSAPLPPYMTTGAQALPPYPVHSSAGSFTTSAGPPLPPHPSGNPNNYPFSINPAYK